VLRAEEVDEAELEEPREARPLLVGVEDAAAQALLVPGVEAGRTDVEVAAHDEGLAAVPLEPAREALEPGELAREVLVADGLPVRHVDAHRVDTRDPRREEPRAEGLLPREADLERLRRLAGEDRHAVPALLPVAERAVADGLELRAREAAVLELQLLERHDVGPALGEPAQQEVLPRAQSVHVPRGDSHSRAPPQPRARARRPAGSAASSWKRAP
jgi:hypothetical protein